MSQMMMNNNMFMNNMGNMNMNTMNTMGNMGNMNMNTMNNMGNMGNIPNQMINNNMQNFQNQMMMKNLQNQMMMNNLQNQFMMNNMQLPLQQMANMLGNNNLNQLNQNPNPQPQAQSEFFTVKFRFAGIGETEHNVQSDEGPSLVIQCKSEELVSSLIEKFRIKSGFKGPAKFVFNAKNLNPSLTIAESGITNGSYIFVVATERVKGAY